ncbi:erythroblast NAD(P)(+)--arginine ADP-ribosyltransferase-like [Xenopus tropicalis]|nr:erythroblast NAD(P)(+)--arginine ADP-ribosyltransferase-like [Xenopus tropicalis]
MTWALALIPTLALMHLCEGNRTRTSWRDTLFSLESVLDMAPNSYDDQYSKCIKKMEAEISTFLSQESYVNRDFSEAWDVATTKWENIKRDMKVPSGFKDEYAIATLVYTSAKPDIYTPFNEAVRQAGQSRDYYLRYFNYKALHYYLTRAVQMLKTKSCHNVFRGTKTPFSATQGNKVRFGQFTSSSTKKTVADEFGTGTNFTITTCHGASIKHLSFFPSEEEVLIPPYETFKVTDVRTGSGSNVITLVSVGTQSNHNCWYLKAASPGMESLQIIPICWLMLLWGPVGSLLLP